MTRPGGKVRRAGQRSTRRGRPKGSGFFARHPEVADAIFAIRARQALSVARLRELLATRFAALPSDDTIHRYVARIEAEHPALLASTRDPDGYRSKYRLALGRADGGVTRVHEVWELDTTKADVMTRGGRMMILGLVDRFSRLARFIVAPSESGQSVRRLLVGACTAWGVVPEAVATDNGAGYINRSIVSALDLLGIEHRLCPPGSPEKKPFVERIFGTFTRERAALLPGFSGHSVADAQRLRARAKKETGRAVITADLDPAELQRILDAWVDGVYHHRRHGSLGVSPLQKAFRSVDRPRQAPAPEILKKALSRYEGSFTVGKRGIAWRKGRYWSPALVPFVGRQVEVRRDEDDLGALLVFDDDGRFIDTAVNHQRLGVSEAAFASAARRHQAAAMAAARADLRARQRAFDIDRAIADRLRLDAETAGKLVTLPVRPQPHSTPALDSLVQAPAPTSSTGPDIERVRRVVRQLPPAEPSVADKVAAADNVIAAAAAGEAVDPAQLARCHNYTTSSEYRAYKMLLQRFGGAA
jgi:transposase InsO family protein